MLGSPITRIYIDRNLDFCPVTPFTMGLGTALLSIDHDDMNLLGQVVLVVESFESTARQRLVLRNYTKFARYC
jgi:hypothetical protein